LPGGKVYVEVVKKAVATSKEPISGEASFFFLTDKNDPYSPAPSSGSLTVGKKKVTLKSEGDALVTPTGPPLFARGGDVDGTLSVELDGKPINIPLGVR